MTNASKKDKKDKKAAKKIRKLKKSLKKEKRKQKEKRTNDTITPTSNDMTSTPFCKKKIQMLVSLLPQSLTNIQTSIQKQVSQLLLKYNDGIGGVLLTYSNIQYLECKPNSNDGDHSKTNDGKSVGVIWGELPYIHYQVKLDALVFEPTVGMKLKGVVNECFPSHVGMLVRSFFNAMIPAAVLNNHGYVFNPLVQKWQKKQVKTNDSSMNTNPYDSNISKNESNLSNVGFNDEIPFIVEKIHECAGVISIEGSL